jgi:hypothetical protein
VSPITPNLLELLGAFFLGAIVALASLWVLISMVVAEHGDDDDQDDGGAPKERHA